MLEKPNIEVLRIVSTPGTPKKRCGQRIGHLIFHVLRRAPRPLAEDDLLILADVWDRIYGYGIARQPFQLPSKGGNRKAPPHEADQHERDDQFPRDKETLQAGEQRVLSFHQ